MTNFLMQVLQQDMIHLIMLRATHAMTHLMPAPEFPH
jgi:hypothetical protein